MIEAADGTLNINDNGNNNGIENSGTIEAVGGTLNINVDNNSNGVFLENSNMVEAADGGTVSINGSPVYNNGGTIEADDGTVSIVGEGSVFNSSGGLTEAVAGGTIKIGEDGVQKFRPDRSVGRLRARHQDFNDHLDRRHGRRRDQRH